MAVPAIQAIAPEQLARITGGRWITALAAPLSRITFDTRELRPGDGFVALTCGARDGHAFAAEAVSLGARALLVERALPLDLPQLLVPDTLAALGAIATACRRSFAGPVVAITGSAGKTSTKEMLRGLLGEERTHATQGNWNNRIGVPMTLFQLDAAGQDYAVIEAGINQPGEMALLGQMIEADLTILTNIGTAHLELLRTQAGIAEEKIKLASFSRPGAPFICPAAALQYPAIRAVAERAIVLVGEGQRSPEGVLRAVPFRVKASAATEPLELVLFDGGVEASYHIATRSRGMAQNAALALTAARLLGIPEDRLQARLTAWRPGATRGRLVQSGAFPVYSDCYNANPESLCDALEAFVELAPPGLPRCYVIGAMNELGPAAPDYHRSCGGRLSLRPQDRVVFIGPAAMTAAYVEGALEAGAHREQLTTFAETDAARPDLADFRGALFLKGSRSYALEKLLPNDLLT